MSKKNGFSFDFSETEKFIKNVFPQQIKELTDSFLCPECDTALVKDKTGKFHCPKCDYIHDEQ